MKIQLSFPVMTLVLLLNACASETAPLSDELNKVAEPIGSITKEPIIKPNLIVADWSQLTGWANDDILPAWDAFLQSCGVLINEPQWKAVCTAATTIQQPENVALRDFFETYLSPHQIINNDGTDDGLVTGYYEPLLFGSRQPSDRFRYPLHAAPDSLLSVDLGEVYPEFENISPRGRYDGEKIVPFYTRAEIKQYPDILQHHEFLWVDNEVELFFLQIQGSGRVVLEDGEILRIGYADHNGHPYRSIGKLLVERDELLLDQASMQGIKQWGEQNPDKLDELLHQNSRYIFFRELPNDLSGPLGAMGVPLTAGRSIAIDPRAVPQGAPVFLETTWPNTDKELQRLMVAQDTGSAIKGNVRVDFFWGFGQEAAEQAGKMKQKGKIWVLLPNGYTSSVVAQNIAPVH